MVAAFQIAEALVAHVRQTYAQEVALVACYGSQALGTASAGSDLDVYYIPASEKAGALYRSFVVAGIPCEFWPVSWEFAEQIAAGKQRWAVAPSILVNAHVLYARSAADLARFEALQAQIENLQKPENKSRLVAQAGDTFRTVPVYLELLRLACARQDVLGARWLGCQFVNGVVDCLALVNQTFLRRDWTVELEALRQFPCKPDRTPELIEVIVTSGEPAQVQQAAEALFQATRDILVREQTADQESVAPSAAWGGYTAAIREYTHKIVSACGQRNLIKASYVAAQMQSELARMLAQTRPRANVSALNLYSEYAADLTALGWPDLARAIETRDFGYIAEQAQAFAHKAEAYLAAQAVPLNVYETLADAQAYIGGADQ